MYGKVINNEIEFAPVNFNTPDGGLIVNFNKNKDLMLLYGYKELQGSKPTYDPATQELEIGSFAEFDENITVNYKVVDKILCPSVDDQLKELRDADTNIECALAELTEQIFSTMTPPEVI